ncbi:YhcH/YjgK/YiaL family protein [Halodesulfovibrio spirochaetisodalis]|uniref:YhcH/YjgK/YiaL family protein n=1 Tax=Halodesulfovibrio spirochaetisodalis TaxID=1560234 RepID=A0A1B7XIA6_9BACT|nr:YhcH/YjgK/YiaL family protein [Halodesulfovibrio spirochaetisodalis]OBQ55229.1 hypothetical protein SP90_04515 [Halodesulfovibrio spirochaetisodalis]
MIVDILENIDTYECLSPHFATAFEFMRRTDLATLPDGQYEIDGRTVFATVFRGQGKKATEAKMEAHNEYIDIQFVLQGTEKMGWKARSTMSSVAEEPEEYPDVFFYDEEPVSWSTVQSGAYAIFFPEDAHMPLISDGEIHKVIIKVAVA